MSSVDQKVQTTRTYAVNQIPKIPGYGWLTVSALRHLIFQAQDRVSSTGQVIDGNGLNRAIIRVGRKVLIDLDEFDRWIDDHRESVVQERGVGR